jgi:hypothetical protein
MAGAHHAREIRLAGRGKAFGLWLFPAKTSNDNVSLAEKYCSANRI